MELMIKTLGEGKIEGMEIRVDLKEVQTCIPRDDIIYFDGIPCILSTARPLKRKEK